MGSIKGLGTREQRSVRLPLLSVLSGGMIVAAIGLSAVELSRFAQTRGLLQTDLTVAELPVTGMNMQQAIVAWETTYNQPLTLMYGSSPIVVAPSEIGFRIETDVMRGEIDSKLAGSNNYWTDFWAYLMRQPTAPVNVPLAAITNEQQLRGTLEQIAARYDRGAAEAQFDTGNMTFGSGAAGSRLDVEGSMRLIKEALYRPQGRTIQLLMLNEDGRAADMKSLEVAIREYLVQSGFNPDGPDSLVGVTVIDLKTGEEAHLNSKIAFSGMSTMKIPILLNILSRANYELSTDEKWLMGASILCSNNSASNNLIRVPAQGDMGTGLQYLIDTVQAVGASNTYMSAPYFEDTSIAPFSIQSPKTNPDPRFKANPDPWSQTTAEDMAAVMQQLYDCAEYGSGLATVYQDDPAQSLTQDKCVKALELLSGNTFGRLLELGVPVGTRIAHKHGYGGTAAAGANATDAAIVYSPGGDYVISVFLWERKTNNGVGSIASWEAIEGVSRLVYNYFNPDRPMITPRVPENPVGGLGCVMPNPNHPERLSLEDIDSGRFNPDGSMVSDACFDYPEGCR